MHAATLCGEHTTLSEIELGSLFGGGSIEMQIDPTSACATLDAVQEHACVCLPIAEELASDSASHCRCPGAADGLAGVLEQKPLPAVTFHA